jgi:hypothetical protein
MSILGTPLKAHVNNRIYESKQGRFCLVFPTLILKIVISPKKEVFRLKIKDKNLYFKT